MVDEYFGVNMVEEKPRKKFDMHCPLMGSDRKAHNYFQEKCNLRKRDPKQAKTCFPLCFEDRPDDYKPGPEMALPKAPGYKVRRAALLFNIGYASPAIAMKMNCTKTTIQTYLKIGRKMGIVDVQDERVQYLAHVEISIEMAEDRDRGMMAKDIGAKNRVASGSVAKRINIAREYLEIEEGKPFNDPS